MKIRFGIFRIFIIITLSVLTLIFGINSFLVEKQYSASRDKTIENDRQKYLGMLSDILSSKSRSFEKRVEVSYYDIKNGALTEDKIKLFASKINNMYNKMFETVFLVNCTEDDKCICNNGNVKYMKSVKPWKESIVRFDNGVLPMVSKIFSNEDGFFVVYIFEIDKEEGNSNYLIGIFDIGEFLNQYLLDDRFESVVMDKNEKILYRADNLTKFGDAIFKNGNTVDKDIFKNLNNGFYGIETIQLNGKDRFSEIWSKVEIKDEQYNIVSIYMQDEGIFSSRFRAGNFLIILFTVLLISIVALIHLVMVNYRRKNDKNYGGYYSDKSSAYSQYERRISRIFEKAEFGVALFDTSGKIMVCDEYYHKITGFDCDECSYEQCMEAIHPMDSKKISQALEEIANDEIDFTETDIRFKTSNGNWIWIGLKIFKTDPENEPKSISIIFKDITDKKKKEEKLQESIKEAKKAAESKDVFLASMSHEIRTPVNGVIGISKILADTELNEDQKQYVAMIRTAANNLLEIINDILDLSKIQANMMKAKMMPFDLRSLIEKQVKLYALKAHEKSLEMNLFISPEIPNELIGDSQMLQQVLINLISNAVKFTEKGEINIMARLVEQNEGAVDIEFMVEDTGIGIKDDEVKNVFESFIQLDNGIYNANKGTGLGLAISKNMVQLMGGKISLRSVPGKGTQFFFNVPFKIDRSNKVHAKNKNRSYSILKDKKILLVDRNKTSVNYLSMILSSHGMSVYSVMAIEEISNLLKDNFFDLILIDSKEIKDRDLSKIKEMFSGDKKQMARTCLMRKTNEIVKTSDEFCCASSERGILKPVFVSDIVALISNPCDDEDKENYLFLKKKVLLVEDDPINLKVVEITLSKHGCNVVSAMDGKMAVEKYKSDNYDMIFMDINIPEMNGWEVTKKIREMEKDSGKHTLIVGLSAHVMDEERKKSLEMGMDEYMTKPIDDRKLREIMEDLI